MYLRDGCESYLGSSSLEGTHPDNSARKNFLAIVVTKVSSRLRFAFRPATYY